MKKLVCRETKGRGAMLCAKLMVAAVCAAGVTTAMAEEAAAPAAPAAASAAKLDKKAMRAAADAAKVGVSVEEWAKLTSAEKKDRLAFARDKKAAEKKGITVEEFRKQKLEKAAAFAGVPVEEWKNLDDKARREKTCAAQKAKAAERAARKAKKAAGAPAAATTPAK